MDESFKPQAENKEKLTKRVLLADDDKSILYMVSFVLKDKGYIVDEVENGNLILEKIEKENNSYDLIITDNNMPEMNGIDALEHLQNNPIFKKIPFILWSGAGDRELQSRVKKIGGEYLQKPVPLKIIKELTERLLEELPQKD